MWAAKWAPPPFHRNFRNMTLTEVYDTMTTVQRSQLKVKIMQDGLSYSAANAYCRGRRNPKLYYRRRIVDHIKAITGQSYALGELFPGC